MTNRMMSGPVLKELHQDGMVRHEAGVPSIGDPMCGSVLMKHAIAHFGKAAETRQIALAIGAVPP